MLIRKWPALLVWLPLLVACEVSSPPQAEADDGDGVGVTTDVAQTEFERLQALEQGCCEMHAEITR